MIDENDAFFGSDDDSPLTEPVAEEVPEVVADNVQPEPEISRESILAYAEAELRQAKPELFAGSTATDATVPEDEDDPYAEELYKKFVARQRAEQAVTIEQSRPTLVQQLMSQIEAAVPGLDATAMAEINAQVAGLKGVDLKQLLDSGGGPQVGYLAYGRQVASGRVGRPAQQQQRVPAGMASTPGPNRSGPVIDLNSSFTKQDRVQVDGFAAAFGADYKRMGKDARQVAAAAMMEEE